MVVHSSAVRSHTNAKNFNPKLKKNHPILQDIQNKGQSISIVIQKCFDVGMVLLCGGTELFGILDWVGLKGSQVFYLACTPAVVSNDDIILRSLN